MILISGTSHDQCAEFYCCYEGDCLVGTYEILLEQVLSNISIAVPSEPYRNYDNEDYVKEVNCTGFNPKVGTQLIELEPSYFEPYDYDYFDDYSSVKS